MNMQRNDKNDKDELLKKLNLATTQMQSALKNIEREEIKNNPKLLENANTQYTKRVEAMNSLIAEWDKLQNPTPPSNVTSSKKSEHVYGKIQNLSGQENYGELPDLSIEKEKKEDNYGALPHGYEDKDNSYGGLKPTPVNSDNYSGLSSPKINSDNYGGLKPENKRDSRPETPAYTGMPKAPPSKLTTTTVTTDNYGRITTANTKTPRQDPGQYTGIPKVPSKITTPQGYSSISSAMFSDKQKSNTPDMNKIKSTLEKLITAISKNDLNIISSQLTNLKDLLPKSEDRHTLKK